MRRLVSIWLTALLCMAAHRCDLSAAEVPDAPAARPAVHQAAIETVVANTGTPGDRVTLPPDVWRGPTSTRRARLPGRLTRSLAEDLTTREAVSWRLGTRRPPARAQAA